MKKIINLALALSMFMLVGCQSGSTGAESALGHEVTHVATMEIEDMGAIEIQLYGEVAPVSVENFVKLANEGFYEGITFHRVIEGFMAQFGDPTGTGMGGSEETIVGEFIGNGIENDISHVRGVLSMARKGGDNDSASSQAFIVHEDSTFLDGQYAAFGFVTSGMDIVDQISGVSTDANDKPHTDVVIKSVSIK